MVFSRVEIWWSDGSNNNEQPPGLFAEHTDRFIVDDDDMDSNTVAESYMSLKSRSFLHRVTDRVRKRQKQSSKDATQDSNKHSLIWRMFMSSTLQAAVFMWKEYSENLRSIKNTGNNLTMKQMFDISEKLIVGQSDEIYGVNTINWVDSSWKHLCLISSVSRTRRFTYFQILCYALERWTRTHNQVMSGKTSGCGSRVHHNTELWKQLMVSQWNSSGIFSQDSPHCSSATKSKCSCQKWAKSQKNLQDGSSSCRCSTTSHGDLKTMEQECELSANLVSIYARRFPPGKWSFFGLGSEKKWYSTHDSKPQGEWDRVAELLMIKFGESGHPVFREERSKAKMVENYQYTSALLGGTMETASVPRVPACVWWDGRFCRTQLAYLSLARLLARLESSQKWHVRGTRRRARERQPQKPLDPLWSLALNFERPVRDTPWELRSSSDIKRDRWLRPLHSERSPGAAAWPEGALSTPARIRLVCPRPASEVRQCDWHLSAWSSIIAKTTVNKSKSQ